MSEPSKEARGDQRQRGEDHLRRIESGDFSYINVQGAGRSEPQSFLVWSASPREQVEQEARSFILKAYGRELRFTCYPRNYVRKARSLARLGMHAEATDQEVAEYFAAYSSAFNNYIPAISICTDPMAAVTGTFIGAERPGKLPFWRDLAGYVHLAPDAMLGYPLGQKFLEGKPVASLRRWVTEVLLYNIVCELVLDKKPVLHYRGRELHGLELDIWFPSLRLGIEYQGEQHYLAIKCWGGEEGLRKRMANDARKREICAVCGYTLIEVKYDEPVTKEHIREKLNPYIPAH